ncbi:MAG TPA: MauE/DoxX family redox-associated membrane protein [Thermoanaerobaculia bacterium]|nr:MauE/DoxX family redox-associated membrane protein [Thermoanaerobaculia bacterium]
MKHISILSAVFLALIFVFAGIDKIFHFDGFVNALASYAVVPTAVARYLALPVVLSELWVGASLLIPRWRRTAALAGAVLLAIFTVALIGNLYFSPGSICGCWFTLTLGRSTRLHVLQNVVLLALAVSVWLDYRAVPKLRDEPLHGGA